MAVQAPSIDTYLEWGFPLIPLARRSKCPVAKAWQERTFKREELGSGNIGTRLGQVVNIGGVSGTLFALDFDSDNLDLLKNLCARFSLPRTTCVRTGGQHHGYHLFYLLEGEVRKTGGYAFYDATIDCMGQGSFVVLPPSVVKQEYRLLVGFEEIALLQRESLKAMQEEMRTWSGLRRKIAKWDGRDADAFAFTIKNDEQLNEAMKQYATVKIAERGSIPMEEKDSAADVDLWPSEPIRISPVEGLIECFWIPGKKAAERWAVKNGIARHTWDTTSVDFAGSASMSRRYNLEIASYEELLVRLRPGADVLVSVTATINGVTHAIVADEAGADGEIELGGSIPAGKLTQMKVEFRTSNDKPQTVLLRWILLTRPGTRWTAPVKPFDGMIGQTDGPYAPGLSLVFGDDELEAIRSRYTSPDFETIWNYENHRASEEFEVDPESTIRQYSLYAPTRYGRSWDIEVNPCDDGIRLALVGLISRNPRYLSKAAQYAIAFAHMEHWSEGFVDRTPELDWYHSGFAPTVATLKASLLLDWTWNWLTPAGREFIREAIRTKGLPFIENARNAMANQGIRFNKARIIGNMAVSDDWSEPSLCELVRDSIDIINTKMEEAVRPDGTFSEGMGYGKGTTASTLTSYIAASRCLSTSVKELTSSRILPAIRFILEADEKISPIFASFAAGPLSESDFAEFCTPTHLLQGYNSNEAEDRGGHSAEYIFYGLPNVWAPKLEPAAGRKALPQFSSYPDGGWVFMGGDDPDLPRLSFESGLWDGVGHAWLHKNAVTMTGWGETLLLPRFHLAYDDARSNYTMSTKLHNTFSPGERDQDAVGTAGRGSKLLSAADLGSVAIAEADNATAWKQGVTKAIRRIMFVRPYFVLIEDIVELTDEETGVQSWNSLAPWSDLGNRTYESRLTDAKVRVRCLTQTAREESAEDSVHRFSDTGAIVPVSRAAFTSRKSTSHHMISLIEAIPPSGPDPQIHASIADGRSAVEFNIKSLTVRCAFGLAVKKDADLWDCSTDGETAFAIREGDITIAAGAFGATSLKTDVGETTGSGFIHYSVD